MLVRRSEAGGHSPTVRDAQRPNPPRLTTAAVGNGCSASTLWATGKEVGLEYCDRLIDEDLNPSEQTRRPAFADHEEHDRRSAAYGAKRVSLGTHPNCCTIVSWRQECDSPCWIFSAIARKGKITGYQTTARVHDDFQEMMQPRSQ